MAITRARERLFLSGSRGPQFNGKTAKQPSRFLAEMGIDIESFINLTAPAALEAMTTCLLYTSDAADEQYIV